MTHGNTRHGMAGTRFYRIWYSLKYRCRNKNSKNYQYYGGRGISYCKKREKFDCFYNDMYDSYFDGSTIDRIDNNGDYNKKNCRRATRKEQSNNTRNNEIIKIGGEYKNITQRLNIYDLNRTTYYSRISSGMNKKEAITTPVEYYLDKICYNGECLTLSEWSKKLNILYKTLYRRIKIKKYPLDIALRSDKYIQREKRNM